MGAPPGHRLYYQPIKPKKLTPEQVEQGALEYFQWCDDNPWIKKDFVKGGQMAGQIVDLPIQRPYTIEGLCLFLGISMETFSNYLKENGYESYFGICSNIKKQIDNQHLEGGMTGAFNASIVAMKLGLQQKIQNTQNIIYTQMSPEEAEEMRKAEEDAKKD